jgi:HK97 family phage portal protein
LKGGELVGLFDFLNRRDETPITPPVDDVLLRAMLSGEPITREEALTLPAVSGAVDFICSSVACMPVKLYKKKQGKVEEQENDSRVKILNGDTGDTLDAYQMKKAIVEDYLLGKGGYAYIQRYRNQVTALKYVQDDYISIMRNPDPLNKRFTIFCYSNEYKPYEFIKLLRNTKDGASGTGVIVEVSKALETAYRTLLYQLSLVKSGGNKKGFLKSQRKLAQDEINVLKAAWNKLYANNEENVVVLNNGLEFQESSNSSVEMQLNESKKTLLDEINYIFHIYPNDFDRTFKEAIYPIVKAFETALNRDMLLEKEKKNMFFEFDVKEIIRATLKERFEAYKLAKETGFMTLNEIRRAENMEYIEGLDVVNVGLGAVLYDTNTHTYYTPNTGNQTDLNQTDANIQKLIEDKELDTAFEQSGNSSE